MSSVNKPYSVSRVRPYTDHVQSDWVVYERVSPPRVVAQYPTRAQAREAARQLNKEEPDAQKNEV